MTSTPPPHPEDPTPDDGAATPQPEQGQPTYGWQGYDAPPATGTSGQGGYAPGASGSQGYDAGQGYSAGPSGYAPGTGGQGYDAGQQGYPAGGYGTGYGPGYDAGQPQYGPGYQGYGGAPLMTPADQRLWSVLAHLSGFVSNFILPLVLWLVLRERGAFVEDQTKEALNYQITLIILGVVFTVATVVTLGLGAILFLYYIASIVFMIMAAVAASKGETYRYPLCLRLVK